MNVDYDLNINVDYNLNFLQFFNYKLIFNKIKKTAFNYLINLLKCQNADIEKYVY